MNEYEIDGYGGCTPIMIIFKTDQFSYNLFFFQSDSDQEYLVPQKPPGGAARQGSVSPSPVTPNVTFRKVDEDEYLRPVPMPRAANGNRISPPMHDTTSSVEADPRGGIQDFSIETREKQLKKFFPDMDVNQFDKAANIIDGTYDSAGGVEPESNYRGIYNF